MDDGGPLVSMPTLTTATIERIEAMTHVTFTVMTHGDGSQNDKTIPWEAHETLESSRLTHQCVLLYVAPKLPFKAEKGIQPIKFWIQKALEALRVNGKATTVVVALHPRAPGALLTRA